jgi:hypothetical protein
MRGFQSVDRSSNKLAEEEKGKNKAKKETGKWAGFPVMTKTHSA